jgi:SAM-dependent MidA family methyltransferase
MLEHVIYTYCSLSAWAMSSRGYDEIGRNLGEADTSYLVKFSLLSRTINILSKI